jgi:hypothetical protein
MLFAPLDGHPNYTRLRVKNIFHALHSGEKRGDFYTSNLTATATLSFK